MRNKLIILFSLSVILLLSFRLLPRCGDSCRPAGQLQTPLAVEATSTKIKNTTTVSLGKITMEAFMADTPELQELGLSGRDSLPENTGMLFIFPTPGAPGFWMKDMKFSLDMIWISPEGKIVGITKNISPDTYPKAFYPPSVIKYVFEVPAGFSDVKGIKTGDSLYIAGRFK